MKLLFDQNISHRVVLRLINRYPDLRHVRDFNLQFSKDREIWSFARENGFALITFDSDFNELATFYGHPPKIIWLRLGNTSTQVLATVIENRIELIYSFLYDQQFMDISCLEIYS